MRLVLAAGYLLGVRDVDGVAVHHHVERRVPLGQPRVVEELVRQGEAGEVPVEHVDPALGEVRGEQQRPEHGLPQRQALVHRAVDVGADEGVGTVDRRAPAGDVATFAVEDEHRRAGRGRAGVGGTGDDELPGAVEDLTRRCPTGNGHHKR